MKKILKEKQETAETIEKEPEDVTIEQEPEEVKQDSEEDCSVSKRPMEQQEEGPERKRMQVSVKDVLAQWSQRRSAGRKNRELQETKEVQGENKRPRENSPEGESAEVAHGPFLDPAAPARERGRGRALQTTQGDR